MYLGIFLFVTKYIYWIKRRYCDLHLPGCKGFDHWDGANAQPINTACHVKSKGSGGGERNNLITADLHCHRIFEDWPKEKKQAFLPLAQELTKEYRESNPKQQ